MGKIGVRVAMVVRERRRDLGRFSKELNGAFGMRGTWLERRLEGL